MGLEEPLKKKVFKASDSTSACISGSVISKIIQKIFCTVYNDGWSRNKNTSVAMEM
jgi:hypothetical protein